MSELVRALAAALYNVDELGWPEAQDLARRCAPVIERGGYTLISREDAIIRLCQGSIASSTSGPHPALFIGRATIGFPEENLDEALGLVAELRRHVDWIWAHLAVQHRRESHPRNSGECSRCADLQFVTPPPFGQG